MKIGFLDRLIGTLQTYIARPWYPPLLGVLAALDHFVFVIPTDGLLVTSVIAAPKRWLSTFLWITLGSVVGGVVLAAFLQHYGTPFLEWLSPGILETHYWKLTISWVDHYGLWALFAITALPIFQHPVIAITALAGIPLGKIALFMLGGRIVKYAVFTWLSIHAPKVLFRMRPVHKEIDEVIEALPHKPEKKPRQ